MQAFSCLIDMHKNLAFSIALKICGKTQDAEEVVQDAFIKVYDNIDNFRGKSKFSYWLYRIVYNTAISRVRKKEQPTVTLDDELGVVDVNNLDNALNEISIQERGQILKEAMLALDGLDYTVLALFYYEEKSAREVAEIVQKSVPYVKVRLSRARQKLYGELEKMLQKEIRDLL